MTLELHPLCTLFPRMSGAEFDALCEDIKAHGLRSPIVTHGGMILDGGNRYRACLEAGVEPDFTEFDGDNLVSFVLSSNLHRRHMSAGQQAAIVASAQDWATAQIAGSNQHAVKSAGAILHDLHSSSATSRSAESGASLRTQKMADKVARESPELAIQVAHGEISLPDAVEQITGKRPGSKKSPEFIPEQEGFGPDEAELAEALAQQKADAESLQKLLASDDKLAAAFAEIKRINAELVVVKGQRDGLMNKTNELVRIINGYKRQLAKLERKAA